MALFENAREPSLTDLQLLPMSQACASGIARTAHACWGFTPTATGGEDEPDDSENNFMKNGGFPT